ncbi:hypothetical protein NSB04_02650, partial [Blautia pseudococcoides]|nr:hypothetical protein [Blautia pseudococcoides]
LLAPLSGYFIHSLSTLYYYNAPSLATRLTGDYRDRTYTGKCGTASLDTQHIKSPQTRIVARFVGLIFLFELGKFIDVSKHFCLVSMLFMPTFYFIYTYYFDLLIFCCQYVAIPFTR